MEGFLPIQIKSRTFRQNPESGSFRSSVVSATSFRAKSFWPFFCLFGLDGIYLFQTLEKDLWRNGCILSRLQLNGLNHLVNRCNLRKALCTISDT